MATKKTKQEILKQGQRGEFWKILVDGLDESIIHIRNKQNHDDFKELPGEQYKLMNELLKAKILYLEKLKALPEDMISWLENPDSSTENYDPYATPEDIDK